MEWAFDMQWTLTSQPKGTPIALTAPPGVKLPAKTVATKYSAVGISANIIPGGALLEGQNSAGLGMSGNFLPGFTQYQAVTAQDTNYVSILAFGSWALGNLASVAEVRAALPTIKVWSDPSLPSGPTPPTLHFVFTDRSGAGVVVEYVNGELRMHDNAAHVLTNAPTYDWHLLNLRNYLNLSTVGLASLQIGTQRYRAGQAAASRAFPATSRRPRVSCAPPSCGTTCHNRPTRARRSRRSATCSTPSTFHSESRKAAMARNWCPTIRRGWRSRISPTICSRSPTTIIG
jgi:choloylglycine hydrolase